MGSEVPVKPEKEEFASSSMDQSILYTFSNLWYFEVIINNNVIISSTVITEMSKQINMMSLTDTKYLLYSLSVPAFPITIQPLFRRSTSMLLSSICK